MNAEEMEARIETLESQVRTLQTLLDIEEIKKLHARYTFYIDENRWDDVLDLFTEDAIGDWGSGTEGTRCRYEGKKAWAVRHQRRSSADAA